MRYVPVVVLLCFVAVGVAAADLGWPPTGVEARPVYLIPEGADFPNYQIGPADETTAMRAFKGGGFQHQCNDREVSWRFVLDASMAQWSVIDVDYTDLEAYIRKPGKYIFDSITLFYKSNGDLAVSHDWTDLIYQGAGGVDLVIELWFQITECSALPVPGGWVDAYGWNQIEEYYADDRELHLGIEKSLWIGLNVEECNSACEYAATGVHTVTLQNQKEWLDDDGKWLDGVPDINFPVLDP